MSRHLFETIYENELTQILMGWDQQLHGYFLVIYKESDDEPFYSNLNEYESHPKTLKPFLEILYNYGISIPNQVIIETQEDAINNIGNKDVTHFLVDNLYHRLEADIDI